MSAEVTSGGGGLKGRVSADRATPAGAREPRLIRNAFRCRRCGVVVESKHVHDFRQCRCGNFADGGLEYVRRGGNLDDMEELNEYA